MIYFILPDMENIPLGCYICFAKQEKRIKEFLNFR